MMVDLKRETWTWRPNSRSPALPMRQYGTFNPGMGLGGAAVHWSAQLWRYLETDFRTARTSSTATARRRSPRARPSRTGAITYHELEPYYDAFEWDIGASGQAGQHQRARSSPAATRSRRRGAAAYPNPPLEVTPLGDEVRQPRAESLGLHPFTQPAGHHLARVDRPVRQPPRRLPLLRLLHAVRLRGRREGEPAQHALPGRARDRTATRCATNAKVLRIEVDERRARHRGHLRRPAGRRALPAGGRRRRVGVHAREQPRSCCCRAARPIRTASATTAAGSGRTTRTRSTRRR